MSREISVTAISTLTVSAPMAATFKSLPETNGRGWKETVSPGAARLDHAVADCVVNQLNELSLHSALHNRTAVGLHGAHADTEPIGNLFVALVFCQELKDLALARTQWTSVGSVRMPTRNWSGQ